MSRRRPKLHLVKTVAVGAEGYYKNGWTLLNRWHRGVVVDVMQGQRETMVKVQPKHPRYFPKWTTDYLYQRVAQEAAS